MSVTKIPSGGAGQGGLNLGFDLKLDITEGPSTLDGKGLVAEQFRYGIAGDIESDRKVRPVCGAEGARPR